MQEEGHQTPNASNLNSNFQASRAIKRNTVFVPYKLGSLKYFVTAAQKDWDRTVSNFFTNTNSAAVNIHVHVPVHVLL